MNWKPLPREEVIKTIERQNPSRIPLVLSKWWGEGLVEQYGDRLKEFDRFPDDVGFLWLQPLKPEEMGLSWEINTHAARDRQCVIDDWAKLDEFIEKLPNPEIDSQFDALYSEAERIRNENLYVMVAWWRLFFERPWGLRGMENLLIDYYTEQENIHRLHEALLKVYSSYLRRAIREFSPDGFFTSDDLGHQTQPMMKPEIFDELIKPYYTRLGDLLHENNMHWWLHSCGNNTPLLPSLIEAGVDVFHPVQKGTMNEVNVVREFGDQITFLAGFDVQHTMIEKNQEQVRQEVRFLIDTFDLSGGGMCLAAGNGIVSGTPFENIEAFLDEALNYGTQHRKKNVAFYRGK